jgi:hypothetical protein
VQFTCWGVEWANEGGKGIGKNLLNILRGLDALARDEVLRSVRRLGVFHVVSHRVRPWYKPKASHPTKKHREAVDASNN